MEDGRRTYVTKSTKRGGAIQTGDLGWIRPERGAEVVGEDLYLEATARLEQLMRRHHLTVVRFIRGKVPDSDVDDVVQDVWLRVWRVMTANPGVTDAPALVRALARRAVAQYWRDRSRTVPEAAWDTFETLERTPDELLDGVFQETLWSALDALPRPQRAMLVDRVFHERSTTDLAKRYDVPTGTVKSRLFNARQRLRDQLRPWYDSSFCAELAASPLQLGWGLGSPATVSLVTAHLAACPGCRHQWHRLSALADRIPEGRITLRVGIRVEPGGPCWLEGDIRIQPDLPRTLRVGVTSDVGPLQRLVDDRGVNVGPRMRRLAGTDRSRELYVAWDSGTRSGNAVRRLRLVHRVEPERAATMKLLTGVGRAAAVSYDNVPSYSVTGVTSAVLVALPPGARLVRVSPRHADTVDAFGRTWVFAILAGTPGQQHHLAVHFTR